VDRSLQDGDLFTAPVYLVFSGILAVERGKFGDVGQYTDKLSEIGEVYDNNFLRVIKCFLRTRLLLQHRKLFEALREVEAGMDLSGSAGQDIFLLSFNGLKANIQVLQGDMEQAEESLERAKQLLEGMQQLVLRKRMVTPVHISSYHLSRFLFDIYSLEKNTRGDDKLVIMQSKQEAGRSGKSALKTAAKCAISRTETFRLMGVYYWLKSRQEKALAWWEKSIRTGRQMDAAPELARTYMEVGKRLMEKKSKFRQCSGFKAPELLQKARQLFEDMEMEWDLHLLDKIESPPGKGEGETKNV
jgi:tetratricopeptide (TPR) repeat protein